MFFLQASIEVPFIPRSKQEVLLHKQDLPQRNPEYVIKDPTFFFFLPSIFLEGFCWQIEISISNYLERERYFCFTTIWFFENLMLFVI